MVTVIKYLDGEWTLTELRDRSLRHSLDGLAALHGAPLIGQKPPYHACARVYQNDNNPFIADIPRIRDEVVAKYVTNDCSLDVRILVVANGALTNAYLIPWSTVQQAGAGWAAGLDKEQFRAAVPADAKPEDLRNDAA